MKDMMSNIIYVVMGFKIKHHDLSVFRMFIHLVLVTSFQNDCYRILQENAVYCKCRCVGYEVCRV